MPKLTPQEMAGKLLADDFGRPQPMTQSLSDPLYDTPLVVTLDELCPYELNPRLTRNPLYDDIKASIRERGLDAPPSITRRPGAEHYIIRNGGNTRLAILRELWSQTKEERFFRISCLFRPWPERGEIVALTGHLAENELHGRLSFIERALGVEKARELYERENGKGPALSQSELARRLSADGYPVQQSHISRMRDTVRYLLPAIPNILYGGLGRHQTERLAVLRKAGELTWEHHRRSKTLDIDFGTLFHDVLSAFDVLPAAFSVRRVQDELTGQMAERLGVDYNVLDLDIGSFEERQRAMMRSPGETVTTDHQAVPPNSSKPGTSSAAAGQFREEAFPSRPPDADAVTENTATAVNRIQPESVHSEVQAEDIPIDPFLSLSGGDEITDSPHEPIVSPLAGAGRLQTIRRLVAEHAGEAVPGAADSVPYSILLPTDGLFPITDVWHIEPEIDTPERLRLHIAQFAREIAGEAGLSEAIEAVDTGLGFICTIPAQEHWGHAVLVVLHALNSELGLPLLGHFSRDSGECRLSDSGLVKFFRLLRLSRQLIDRESGTG